VQSLQALAEAGQRIGLNVQYKSVSLDQFYAFFGGGDGWKGANADGFGSQWNAPVADPLSMYSLWSDPKGFLNYGQFANNTASSLIEKAAGEADSGTRATTLAQVDKLLATEMPWVPVVDVANVLFLGKDVTGPPASQTNWFSPWAADLGRIGS
jgi:peptide/nickel transport system substrate-binding protein